MTAATMAGRGHVIFLPGTDSPPDMPGGGANPLDETRSIPLKISHSQIVPLHVSFINDNGMGKNQDDWYLPTITDLAFTIQQGALPSIFNGHADTPQSSQLRPTKVNEFAGVPPSANPNRIL